MADALLPLPRRLHADRLRGGNLEQMVLPYLQVAVDGDPVHRAVGYDLDAGWVEAYVNDHAGRPVFHPEFLKIRTRLVRGRVRIWVSSRAPEGVRRRFEASAETAEKGA